MRVTVRYSNNNQPRERGEFVLSLDESAESLSNFGLTLNQAKVYLTLAKLGLASVSQVSKVSKVRREDVYRILPKLEGLGLIEKVLGTPTKMRATPVEEALSILIKREQDRVSVLKSKTDTFLTNFKAYNVKTILKEEEIHFALVSQRDHIINRGLTMIKDAQREIDIITSRDKLIRVLLDYAEPLKKAMRKGVKVCVISEAPEHEDSIRKVIENSKLEDFKSPKGSLNLKYTEQPLSHFIIVDHKQALISTSTEAPFAENSCLWTDDNNLVGHLQKEFEEVWHTSVNPDTIQTTAVSEKVTHFVGELRPRDHVIFVYQSSEAKYNVLFNYLKIGLENGEAAAYVASEESPREIRDAMKRFGIGVEEYEKTGALRILGCNDIYILDGKFDIPTTMGLWNKLHNEALKKGFKGLRITGEMVCFFEYDLIQELVEYEKALHRVLDIPITAICAYNAQMLTKAKNPINLYTELVRAHGAVLFAGIDNKLGKIEIRKA